MRSAGQARGLQEEVAHLHERVHRSEARPFLSLGERKRAREYGLLLLRVEARRPVGRHHLLWLGRAGLAWHAHLRLLQGWLRLLRRHALDTRWQRMHL